MDYKYLAVFTVYLFSINGVIHVTVSVKTTEYFDMYWLQSKKHLVDQMVFVKYIFIWLLISITGKIDEYSQNNM